AITIDPGSGAEQYQGLVSLAGPTLAAALEDYFHRSEQLPTRLWLAADPRRAAGLLLQRLPGTAADPDAWSRIQQLGATVTATELLGLDDRDTLGRLFHQETVRLLAGQALSFRCTCSRQRTAAMLRALGAGEVQQILAGEGRVSVECQFCGMAYDFDAVDAAGLLADAVAPDMPATRH
ncbi:MAG: Hsp33 family molecular chaperone HslO, partial [Pseudomonadota bacterium]|nr:Hsp33 family molecular chaperone HslO [Pseudomonadota bacterium]